MLGSRKLITVAAGVVAILGGAGVSLAATGGPARPQHDTSSAAGATVNACVNNRSHAIYKRSGSGCAHGYTALKWNVTGPKGAQGPSGVQAVTTDDLGGLASANSGGSFYAGGSATSGAVEVGSPLSVAVGTYQVCMNAKATPESAPQAGTDTGISAQFFLYDQAKNSSFAGDLLNTSTPLQPDGTNHDSYVNGCTLVTVPSGGQSWYVYAFGYQTDDGSGNYAVDDVTLNLVALTPAN